MGRDQVPRFDWRARIAKFWNKTGGRVISRLRAGREASRIASLSPVSGLADQVFGGELPMDVWQTNMRQEIKTHYIQQYLAGRGGVGPMTQADWGSVGGQLADQYRYLDGFAREVAEGKLSKAQIAQRSEMYMNSSREAFERGQKRASEVAGLDEVVWLKTAMESCPDCIELANLGWQKAEPWPFKVGGRPAIPGSGVTQCLTNCRCYNDWRKGGAMDVSVQVHPAGTSRTIGDKRDALLDELKDWEGARANAANQAVNGYGFDLVTLRDGNELVGVGTITPGTRAGFENYYEVPWLATKRSGYGRQTINRLAEEVISRDGSGFYLSSSLEARDFYKAIGMTQHPTEVNLFSMATRLSEADEIDIAHLEPEDGVFAVPGL